MVEFGLQRLLELDRSLAYSCTVDLKWETEINHIRTRSSPDVRTA